jgi:hypothetical protein
MANDKKSEKRGGGTFKLFMIVVILLLIPTTMEQLSMHPDTVRNVGRVCVGIAVLFFLYGLVSKALKFVGVVLLVLIAIRALANEGIVQIPNVLEKHKAEDLKPH